MTTAEMTEITESLAAYIRKPEIIQRFSDALGGDHEAMIYIQSVLILVQNSDPGEYSLQNCSHQSIVRSALRAVTLRVSVDPALRQAWLVPRRNSKSGKIEACLQLHYAEVRNRAMRTGRYRFINVSPVYFGETVFENIYTGLHQIQLATGTMTQPTPVDFSDGWVPVGSREGNVIGWLGYSETTKGAKQTVYMTVGDIEKHIKSVQAWGMDTKAWKNNRQTMERKTVLLALLRKEDLAESGMEKIKTVIDETEQDYGDHETGDVVDGEAQYVYDDAAQAPPSPAPAPVVTQPAPKPSTPTPAPAPTTPAPPVVQAYGKVLKYSVACEYRIWVDGKDMRLGDMTVDQLDAAENDPKRAESTKKAIRVVRSQKVSEAMEKENKA